MEGSAVKALSRETKALILVSEFEARRMPMFQLRQVLDEIIVNEEEKKMVIDLVENDLRATGYHPNQINAFLQDLLSTAENSDPGKVQVTRRLRSPFAQSFEDYSTPLPNALSAAGAPAAKVSGTNLQPAAPTQRAAAEAGSSQFKMPTNLGPARAPGIHPLPTQTMVMPVGKPVNTDKRQATFFGGNTTRMQLNHQPAVLLADDDKRIRIVFRLCLERLGFRVVEAEDGTDAWKKVQEGGFCLIVLDMKMPGLHGLEVLSRMINQQLQIPAIICSAYDQLKDEFVVATYPKLRYLVKPVAAEDLENAVKELVELPASTG